MRGGDGHDQAFEFDSLVVRPLSSGGWVERSGFPGFLGVNGQRPRLSLRKIARAEWPCAPFAFDRPPG